MRTIEFIARTAPTAEAKLGLVLAAYREYQNSTGDDSCLLDLLERLSRLDEPCLRLRRIAEDSLSGR